MNELLRSYFDMYGFQLLFIALAPFLFLGIINRVKSFWAGRKGPSLFQPFFDTLKLLRKGSVFSASSTIIFQVSTSISLGSVILAVLLIPIADIRSFLDFDGNFIVFAYALGLSRFFSIIAALDTGSSFEGMGANRKALFSSLMEPAFFLLFGTLSAFFGKSSFNGLFEAFHGGSPLSWLYIGFTALFLFISLITEGCRSPIDDPAKPHELTMVHDAMILDNSGPDLAFIQYTSGLKMVIFGSLIASLILPSGLSVESSRLIFCGIIILESIAVGCIESWIARLRMTHVPQFLFITSSIALVVLSVLSFTVFGGKL